VQALEEPKNFLLVLGWNPDAIVLNEESDVGGGGLGPDSDLRPNAFGDKFERVGQEIREDLFEGGGIGPDIGKGLFDFDGSFSRQDILGQMLENSIDVCLEALSVAWQVHVAKPAICQKVANEGVVAGGSGGNSLEVILNYLLEGITVVREERLRKTLHGAIGSAQIVSDIITDPFEGADALVEMGGSLLDGLLQILIGPGQLRFGITQFSLGGVSLERFAKDIADGFQEGGIVQGKGATASRIRHQYTVGSIDVGDGDTHAADNPMINEEGHWLEPSFSMDVLNHDCFVNPSFARAHWLGSEQGETGLAAEIRGDSAVAYGTGFPSVAFLKLEITPLGQKF
jgi:hypothetical protein